MYSYIFGPFKYIWRTSRATKANPLS